MTKLLIQAFCDSLCEPNPGDMHVGYWAKTDDGTVLFNKHARVGYGTCNEAEYHALFNVVNALNKYFLDEARKATGNAELTEVEWPEVVIHSDSQLMTKQLLGLWKTTKPEIQALYTKAENLRKKHGFTIKWIPREQNSIADGLAQEQKLKGSGRNFVLDDGRFRVRRNTPCSEVFADNQMFAMLCSPKLMSLRADLEIALNSEIINYTLVEELVVEMRDERTALSERIIYPNSLVRDWLEATFRNLGESLDDFLELAKSQNPLIRERVDEFFHHIEHNSKDGASEEETAHEGALDCSAEELADYALTRYEA